MSAKTPDGIMKIDWKEIEDLAEKIALGDDFLIKQYTEEILNKLNALQNKYGDKPSILATKADYINNIEQEIILLKKAYEIAQSMEDRINLTLTSSALAQRYVEIKKDAKNGRIWLNEFKACLNDCNDEFEAEEYTRLDNLLRNNDGQSGASSQTPN